MKEERVITQTNAHNFILRVPEGSFVNQYLYITHAQARTRAHTHTHKFIFKIRVLHLQKCICFKSKYLIYLMACKWLL